MYESFRSHCLQDYPEYELLFGVADPNDPAVDLVERLRQEFPQCTIKLIRCDKQHGANGKVSALVQLTAAAKHEIFLVNDSDIRVEPDYLRTVSTELQEKNVGLVTCLYRGIPTRTISSRIEALGISTDFSAGVLAAQLIEGGVHFGLGSTLAFRRSELEAIGGFNAIVDYLADDYELGNRIADRGARVILSRKVVETFLPAYDLTGFLRHQLRWARTVRASRPGGYAGLLFTFTLPWAILCAVLAGGATWALALLVAAVSTRILAALVGGILALRDREVLRSLWLLPLRDVLALAVWAGGVFGRKITWRGETFELKNGKLNRVE